MNQSRKIYHIVHIDRLDSIVSNGFLYSDAKVIAQNYAGTTIGISKIKQRRLKDITLSSYPDLHVGECVPFYFCPRSVMLYILHMGNYSDINYKGGQENIIHLEADLYKTIEWANVMGKRWVFTDANAGSYYFNDYNDINSLNKLNWNAINSDNWQNYKVKEAKQAEFLCEGSFDFRLVERIGVVNSNIYQKVQNILGGRKYNIRIETISDWYY